MSEPIEVVRRFVNEYQTQTDKSAIAALLALDFVDHTPFPGFPPTREGVRQLFEMLWGAFPDLRAEILHQYAQEDRVATHKVFRGIKARSSAFPPPGASSPSQ